MTCHVARRVGEFERRLQHDRREVSRALSSTDEELGGLERQDPGELADDAARNMMRRLLSRLEDRDWRVLSEIDAAEKRLSEGTFGICEACREPIPYPRLRALPTARLCVTCEETAERALVKGATRRPPAG